MKAKEKLGAAFAKVVVSSKGDLLIKDPFTDIRIVHNQETTIGDLCADAYRYISGAEDNMLSVSEATGQEFREAIEYSGHAWSGEFGGWLCPLGIGYDTHIHRFQRGERGDRNV